jgi:uncharacterized protein (DUF433 family)
MDSTTTKPIEITPGVCGGKPRIAGHRIRVQDIVVWTEHQGQSPDEIVASFPQLTINDVQAALSYYAEHRDEIREQMREDDRIVAEMKAKYGPGPFEQRLKEGLGGDSVSSR